jgi:hypothetical protein
MKGERGSLGQRRGADKDPLGNQEFGKQPFFIFGFEWRSRSIFFRVAMLGVG